jgi:hypothetical protein
VAALAAIVILAACGPASSNSGEPSSEASVAASEAASQPLASTTTDTGNGDLAGILPDEIDGIPLTYQFQSGSDVLNGEGVTPEVQAALNRLGADIDDVSTAFGFGIDQADPANPRSVSIFAMRVAGADSDQLLEEFRTSMGADNALTETNVGGKTVLTLGSDAGTAEGYMYVTGDTVFMVAASPLELSAEILSALP